MSDDPVQNPYTSPNESSTYASGGQSSGPETIAAAARIGQIISMALISGICFISGILLFIGIDDFAEAKFLTVDDDSMLFLGIGFVVAFGSFVGGYVLRNSGLQVALRDWVRNTPDVELPISPDTTIPNGKRLLGGFATANITGAAIMESGAVINAVFLLINEHLLHLIPIGLAIFGILLLLPTTSKYQHLIEDAIQNNAS